MIVRRNQELTRLRGTKPAAHYVRQTATAGMHIEARKGRLTCCSRSRQSQTGFPKTSGPSSMACPRSPDSSAAPCCTNRAWPSRAAPCTSRAGIRCPPRRPPAIAQSSAWAPPRPGSARAQAHRCCTSRANRTSSPCSTRYRPFTTTATPGTRSCATKSKRTSTSTSMPCWCMQRRSWNARFALSTRTCRSCAPQPSNSTRTASPR